MITDADRRAHLDRLLGGTVCFDTTVPLYLADAGHAATLVAAFRDRAIIPPRVAGELVGLSHGSHPQAIALLGATPFARTVALTPAEDARVITRLRRWNGSRVFESPNQDRGEAECVELCLRNRADGVALCTQDSKAINEARIENIHLFNAVDICLAFALSGFGDRDAWVLYAELAEHGMYEVRRFPPGQVGWATFETVLFHARRVLAAPGPERDLTMRRGVPGSLEPALPGRNGDVQE